MSGVWIIFQREMGQYFASPVAYLIAFSVLVLTGVVFNYDLAASITVKPADPALIPTFLSFVMIFFAPLLTMRLLAEENREGTMELLLTAPVTDLQIVLGKFFSAWAYYTLLLAVTFSYQFILASISFPDTGHAFAAYIGIWLYGGATLAVGLFFSSLTENQIVAAFLSMAALVILWIGDLAGEIVSNIDLAIVIRNLTLQGHFSTSFAAGLVRFEDIAYFAGIILIMLFATFQVVQSHRWR